MHKHKVTSCKKEEARGWLEQQDKIDWQFKLCVLIISSKSETDNYSFIHGVQKPDNQTASQLILILINIYNVFQTKVKRMVPFVLIFEPFIQG